MPLTKTDWISMYCKGTDVAASTSKNMPGDGDGGFKLKVVFVSFNDDDDDDDDDKGARLCDDAMMRGQKEREKER
tara:strand:+ start:3997 stop:4221 length:225 start_codon:yes stop_codon:yes gene_type:complete